MSIVIDETTKVVVQGVTGRMATFHTEEMVEYGTNVVAGASPGKGGGDKHDAGLSSGFGHRVLDGVEHRKSCVLGYPLAG